MTKTTVTLSSGVRGLLRRSTVSTANGIWFLALPPGQLDRKLYVEVNRALEAAGGKWDRKVKGHVFAKNPSPLLFGPSEVEDEQKKFQAYYTPPELARRVVELAQIKPGMLVLEPSAGEGALADEVHDLYGVQQFIRCVEVSQEATDVLLRKGFNTRIGDFLSYAYPSNEFPLQFDRVVMNPPFTQQQDIKHVLHAIKFVRLGGILVAVMSPAFEFRTTALAKELRSSLSTHKHEIEDVPAGTFDDTNISTRILTIYL